MAVTLSAAKSPLLVVRWQRRGFLTAFGMTVASVVLDLHALALLNFFHHGLPECGKVLIHICFIRQPWLAKEDLKGLLRYIFHRPVDDGWRGTTSAIHFSSAT